MHNEEDISEANAAEQACAEHAWRTEAPSTVYARQVADAAFAKLLGHPDCEGCRTAAATVERDHCTVICFGHDQLICERWPFEMLMRAVITQETADERIERGNVRLQADIAATMTPEERLAEPFAAGLLDATHILESSSE